MFKPNINRTERKSRQHIIIERGFNIPLSTLGRSLRQKINKETLPLNYTLDQRDLTEIYRMFHFTSEYKFFSSADRIFSGIDLMLDHKASLHTFKVEIIPNIFSNHNGMKLKSKTKGKRKQNHNYMEIKQYFLNSNGSKNKSEGKSETILM